MQDQTKLAGWIGAAAKGDRTAFKQLYDLTSPKLFGAILRILRNRSAAEEVLQDVFLRIWQNAASYSPEAAPHMAWMYAIARNRAIDVLRVKTPVLAAPDEDGTDWYERVAEPRDRENEMMDIAQLRHCLGLIEEPARSMVLAAYYEGHSREELALRYDRPVNTIKTWLHRSLSTLKGCMEMAS
jgi:RNA polymerase sigma factor (sigma-70 family)